MNERRGQTQRAGEAAGRSAWLTIARRLGGALLTLLIIAYITQFGLLLAERGRLKQPARPLEAAGESVVKTVAYLFDHPATYYMHRENIPVLQVVGQVFGPSAGLLFISLGLAALLGIPLGIGMALGRRRSGSALALLISVLGVSTPSFLLAMLLWVFNLWLHNTLGTTSLPPTGFGWDAHVIMPALVLAARPLAQVAQITYVSLSDTLGQDFIRTAHSKGLSPRAVHYEHALRHALAPILSALGASTRFSLASLPIVEYFFVWPGVGLTLLQTISQGNAALVTDLIVSLGLLFLLINLILELTYPLLDPRLREAGVAGSYRHAPLREAIATLREVWAGWLRGLRARLAGAPRPDAALPPLPSMARADAPAESPAALSRRAVWRALREPLLIIGFLMVLGFFALAVFGDQLTAASPYKTHGVMMIEGVIGAPPYKPSPTFPWGTDHIGRDLQALVLAGARQTLALAFFGMLARMVAGGALGALAGWRQGGRLDRLVNGAANVWAAFPITIFAALLIQAIGIQQGMWVFIVAFCLVGWGEIAQVVRRQVIGIKPQLFIESAQSAGARPGQILVRHVVPNLLPALLVLAVLEMGGVLMLLAELGFLNIFLGGGFKAELAVGQVSYYSDVPEWGALLANIRAWWRSYPWFAWYPGVAFFLTIMAFNVFGEGLRRFIERSRVNVSRLFNRYTALAGVAVIVALALALRSVAPLGLYRSEVRRLDTARIMEDIRALAGPQFAGRELGLPGAHDAAGYIAQRMEAIGLIPIGDKGTFIQTTGCAPYHLDGMPELSILDAQGQPAEKLVYRQDFVEYSGLSNTAGAGKGQVVGLVTGGVPDVPGADPYRINQLELRDKILIVPEKYDRRLSRAASAGTLIVASDPEQLQRRYMFTPDSFSRAVAVQYISAETAERLLATAGSSLAELERRAAGLGIGEVAITEPGVAVQMKTPAKAYAEPDSACYNVLGIIPGSGAEMGARQGQGMDSQIIMVTAYYDGLGIGPDGAFYPGANDNASGVALLLEMARVLKETPFQPKKTIMFVAWAGGERWLGLSTKNIMNSQPGFSDMTIEAVIELAGVGAGAGKAIALEPGSSYRLVQLFEKAAGRLGTQVTARGRGPHRDQVVVAGFGGRSAMSAYVSWDGAYTVAHGTGDTPEAIDQDKLRRLGETTLLSLLVMGREPNY